MPAVLIGPHSVAETASVQYPSMSQMGTKHAWLSDSPSPSPAQVQTLPAASPAAAAATEALHVPSLSKVLHRA